jgi:hypothetical protein
MNLDLTMILTILVGTLIPILNGLLTKASSVTARTYLQLVLNAAAGFGMEWLDALVTGAAYDVRQAATAAILSLVVAISTQAGVWKPLGVSDWAKSHGNTPAQYRLTD